MSLTFNITDQRTTVFINTPFFNARSQRMAYQLIKSMNESNVAYDLASSNVSDDDVITTEEVERHQTATVFINLLVPPILITVGVTCNTMTIMTMRTKYFRNVSTSVYFKVGAMNDVLALLISLSAHWLYVNLPGVYVRTDTSHVMCKFFNFYGAGNNDLGILLTASMTAERALVIASPFGAAKFCSVKRAWRIVFGLISFVVLKNMHFLLSSDIVAEGRTDRLCDVYPERLGPAYETFSYDFWPWIHLAYVLICGIAIVINNSVILYFVHKSQADRKSGGAAWRHLVPMLIGESVLLIALTFPFSLHLALLAIRLKYDNTIYTDPNKAATEALVFSVTFYMLYSNKCANFFMYCVTGSRFRDGLSTTLLNFCKTKRLRKRISSSVFVSTITEKLTLGRNELSCCHGDCAYCNGCQGNCNCTDINCGICDRNNCRKDLNTEKCLSDYNYVSSVAEKTQKSISVYI